MAANASRTLECPISWFVNMTKIRAAIPDIPFLPPGVRKAELMLDSLPIILTLWLCIAADNFHETIFKCEHAICRPMRKVLLILVRITGLGVMIMLPSRLLANGCGVYELYPYFVGFGFMLLIAILLRLSNFVHQPRDAIQGCLSVSDFVRKKAKKVKKMKEVNNFETSGGLTPLSDPDKMLLNMRLSHVRHMIDIGSLSVRLTPAVVNLYVYVGFLCFSALIGYSVYAIKQILQDH